ncbi:NB-ARC domain-containing protein [Micromonospora sp. NPDC048170]|uniref:NB-ARC domain-containing protein n=1 Tax=Micromonospora sp. NPDC048170 TaxID=3154819 RepID=UPI00340A8D37
MLAGFLRALGVAGGSVPADQNERLHMFRTLTARRNILVVLDDTAGAWQVRDLAPTGDGCGAVVTSRTSLADLDATRHPFTALRPEHAVELLADMIDVERPGVDMVLARAVVERCDRLPLTVWIAGACLATRPHLTLADMNAAFTETHRRPDARAVGEVAVRASLATTQRDNRPGLESDWLRLGHGTQRPDPRLRRPITI